MNLRAIGESDETLFSGKPNLSHSKSNRDLLCPEQYHCCYLEGFRLKVPSVSLVFGQFIHQALAYFFNKAGDPIMFFIKLWEQIKSAEL